jgi:three-Cys-motif partner protein
MTVPRGTRWPIQPHTKAKHEILRRYLQAWLPMLAKYHGRIVVIDGFAGPGRYEGGEEGSPLIALKTLINHDYFKSPQAGREAVFLFIEQEKARADALQAEVDALEKSGAVPPWVKIGVKHGEFASYLTELLDAVQTGGGQLAPTFAFVDPFGFKGVPIAVIARILRNPRCECFITFMYESINRFIGHSDPAIQAHFDELFGTRDWRRLAEIRDANERREAIIDLYRRQLMSIGGITSVRTFEMINEGNRTEYFLYFATGSLQGLSKMKEAMWHADPLTGQAFSDLTDIRQQVLLEAAPDLATLRDALRNRFHGAGEVAVTEIERFVLLETPYSEKIHLKTRTLAPMERDGLITARHPTRKRRRCTYPEGTLLTFP